jgi:hypothetical protein
LTATRPSAQIREASPRARTFATADVRIIGFQDAFPKRIKGTQELRIAFVQVVLLVEPADRAAGLPGWLALTVKDAAGNGPELLKPSDDYSRAECLLVWTHFICRVGSLGTFPSKTKTAGASGFCSRNGG